MPTYQYSCTECGHFFEAVQSFSDDALTVCPECAGKLRKVYNAVGVVFKGSGFYRTDSRSSANGSATKSADSGSGSGSGEKSGSASGSTTSGSASPAGSSTSAGAAASA